jgi:hypothetical protein
MQRVRENEHCPQRSAGVPYEHWLDVEAQKSPVISDGEKFVLDIRFHRTGLREKHRQIVFQSEARVFAL